MRIMNLFDLPLTSTERFLLNAVNDLEHRISNRIRGSETYIPNIDLSEDKENFYLIAELPGMTDSDVKVSVSDDVLTISGHKERKDEKKERNYHRIERSFGEFVRSISLPTNANAKDVICSFKDGLLEITMPKTVKQSPVMREIPLTTGSTSRNISPKSNGHIKPKEKATLA